MNRIDIPPGSKFGSWTTTGRRRPALAGTSWECRCVCGVTRFVYGTGLRKGGTSSCGCVGRRERNKTHGHASRIAGSTRTYHVWCGMRGRCKDKSSRWYGERGISVCERWKNSFEAFLEDMGECPSKGHSLDRINNDGNYEPGNCRWATQKQQNRNTRVTRFVTYQGQRLAVRDACELVGLPYSAVIQRVQAGWPDERTLTAPVRGGGARRA